jgi:hypothetical protein
MDQATHLELSRNANMLSQIKANLKTLTDQKKILEKYVFDVMNEHDLTELLLSDGSVLNYNVKESITISKDKKKKQKEKSNN